MAMSVDQIKILVKAETKQALKNLKGIHGQSQKVKMGFKDILSAGLGMMGITTAISMVGSAFKKAIKTQMEFEQAIANVQSVSGGARKELALLAREAGKSTVYSATQAADALYFLASAGLKVDDMAEVLTPTLNLAAAAQMEIAEATDIVVGQLKIFGKSMDEAEAVTDVMAQTVRSSNTNMQQLGEALKMAGPLAQAAGISFEDLNAVIGTMANRGIKASMAGTQLRQAIARLINPPKEAEKALAKYNISLDTVKKLLPTPVKLFELLGKKIKNPADMLKILGVRQAGVMAVIRGGNVDLKKMQKALETAGGAAKKMAETQINTLAGQLKLLNSAWEELILTFDQTGAMKNAVKAVRKLVVAMQQLPEMFEFYQEAIKETLAEFQDMMTIVSYNFKVLVKLAKYSAQAFGDAFSAGFSKIASRIPFIGKKFKGMAVESEKALKKSYSLMLRETKMFTVNTDKIFRRSSAQFKSTYFATGEDWVANWENSEDDRVDATKKANKKIIKDIIKTTGKTISEVKKLYDDYYSYTASEHQKAIDKENESYKNASAGLKQIFEIRRDAKSRTEQESYVLFAKWTKKEKELKERHNQKLTEIDTKYAEKKKNLWDSMTDSQKAAFESVLKMANKVGDAIGGEFGKAVSGVTGFVDALVKAGGEPIATMTAIVIASIGMIVGEMQKAQEALKMMKEIEMEWLKNIEAERLQQQLDNLSILHYAQTKVMTDRHQAEMDFFLMSSEAGQAYNAMKAQEEAERIAGMTAAEKAKYDIEKKYIEEKAALEKQQLEEAEALEAKQKAERNKIKKSQFDLEKRIAKDEAWIKIQSAFADVHAKFPMPWDEDTRNRLFNALQKTYDNTASLISSRVFIPEYARGTSSAQAGAALVGERGPEIVNFKGGEQVIPNNRINNYNSSANKSIIIENVSLPNVTDTKEMLLEMQEIADGMGTSLLNV